MIVDEADNILSQDARAANVTIIRDDFGIPHVYGKTDADAYLESFSTNNRKTAEVNACKLLRKEAVAAYIAIQDEAMFQDLRDEHDYIIVRLIQELSHGAFYNIQELLDEHGRLRNIQELPEHIARAIASVKVVTTKSGKVIHEVKMMDKAAAIDKLMKYLGGYARNNMQSLTVSGQVHHTIEPLPEVQELLDAVYQPAGSA